MNRSASIGEASGESEQEVGSLAEGLSKSTTTSTNANFFCSPADLKMNSNSKGILDKRVLLF